MNRPPLLKTGCGCTRTSKMPMHAVQPGSSTGDVWLYDNCDVTMPVVNDGLVDPGSAIPAIMYWSHGPVGHVPDSRFCDAMKSAAPGSGGVTVATANES